jgi:hypothetical protein
MADLKVRCQVSGFEWSRMPSSGGQVKGLHRGVLVTYKVAGGEILLHVRSLDMSLSRVRSLDVSFVTCQVSGGEFCHVSGLWR